MPLEAEKMVDLLLDVQRSIGRLEGKLDTHTITTAAHMAATADALQTISKKDDAQDKAIRALEVNQSRWAGGTAIIAMIGSWLSYHVWPWH